MRLLVAILLLFPCQGRSQSEPDETLEGPDPGYMEVRTPDPSGLRSPGLFSPGSSAPGLDSLERTLALIEVAKAREAVTSSNFWHRLIPHVSLEGGIGVRDLAFPDAGGTILLPKDSYRLTLGLSLSTLLDGSAHTRAELQLAETETRFSILLRRQFLARLALVRKKSELSAEFAALRDELSVRGSAVSYQELLFAQGRADFHAVSGARIDLIRLKHAAARLEARVREIEKTLSGEPDQ